jgi:hypothetical protein
MLRCCDVAILQDKVTQLPTDFERLVGEVSILRSASAGIQTISEEIYTLKTRNAQELNLNDPVVEQLSTHFNELLNEFLIQNIQIAQCHSLLFHFRARILSR